MIWAILGFAFAALGSKVLLGVWAVWVLLPDRPECSRCDGPTAPLEPRAGLRTLARWCGVQHRWCARCGESYLARGQHPPRIFVGRPDGRVPGPASPQVLERRSQ